MFLQIKVTFSMTKTSNSNDTHFDTTYYAATVSPSGYVL